MITILQVTFRYNRYGNKQFCGGALLSESWIITTASCFTWKFMDTGGAMGKTEEYEQDFFNSYSVSVSITKMIDVF